MGVGRAYVSGLELGQRNPTIIAGDAENQTDHKQPTPVQEEFETHLAQQPASVIRLKWDEPIVHEAVEAEWEKVMGKLRGEEGEAREGEAAEGMGCASPAPSTI
jgi:hypothetical protein